MARLAGDGKGFQLAGLHMLHHGRRRGHEDLHLAAQHVLDRRAGALVRHMDHVGACGLLEQGGADMRQRAVALRREIHLARVGLQVGDELLQVGGRNRRVHRDHVGGRCEQGHRRQVFLRPRHLGEHRRVADVIGRVRDQQRVAVLGRQRHVLVGDVAAGAGLVLDDHRLAERLGQRVADDARRGVDHAARRVRHDQRDGLAREGLRTGSGASQGQGREQGEAAGQHAGVSCGWVG